MEKIISIQPHTSLQIDSSLIQRGVYFVLGFGVIVTSMADPPVTMKWMAVANILGAVLVFLAILGKRIVPQVIGSKYLPEPQLVTNTIGLLIGLGISIFAISHPPVAAAWAAYAHIVGIVLVIQGILGYDSLLKSATFSSESRVRSNPRATVVNPVGIPRARAA